MKQKAVFFDRDGVINKMSGKYYVYEKDKLDINDGVIEFMKRLSDMEYVFFIISNQSGIAHGIYTTADADAVNDYLKKKLSENGIVICDILYCPHHPSKSHCLCRKPESLLIEKLIAKYNIDAKNSYLVGDAERDIAAGEKAGLKTVLTDTDDNLMNYISFIK